MEPTRREVLILGAAAAGVAAVGSASAQEPPFEGAWSPTVNGLRGRLVVGLDPRTESPQALIRLELENVSDVANPIDVPSTWTLASSLRDAAGKPVEEAHVPCSVLTPSPFGLVIPYDGRLSFRVSVYGYGVPAGQRLQVSLADHCWVLAAGDRGAYALAGRFTVAPPEVRTTERRWSGELVLPPVTLP